MKNYTILYNTTFKSGHVMTDQQMGIYASDEVEALKKFNDCPYLNSVETVEFVSIVEMPMTHLDREFLRGELSAMGD